MPVAPMHPCAVPHCSVRVPRGVKRCAQHMQQYERQRRQDTPGRLVPGARGHLIDYYQTPAWLALRDQVRDEEPLCRMCKAEGKARPMAIVDHIMPRAQGGPDTRENLQGLCKAHDALKRARERHSA